MYDTILSPIDYGGMQLKNRIIFAPTTFGLRTRNIWRRWSGWPRAAAP